MAFSTPLLTAFLAVGSNYDFVTVGPDAVALQLNPRETVTLAFNFDAAGTTDDLEIEVLQGHRVSDGNGLAGATGNDDLELNAADGFSTDDDMNGVFIVMTSGDEEGEGKLIDDSVASDNGVNLISALTGTPSATETYALYRLSAVYNFILSSAVPTDDIQHNARVTLDAADGEWVLVRARNINPGGTDAHRVRFSHLRDGVSI